MTINALKWQTMTRAINEMKSPQRFLQDLVFGAHETLSTETIEIGLFRGDRRIAPFVRKNGEAIMVEGYDREFQTVEAPNIRIKRPLTASELLYDRQPGSVIFIGDQTSEVEAHIARDLGRMEDYLTNSIEYLCSLAIQGTITYEVADEEVFQITYPRPAANNVDLGAGLYWDLTTGYTGDVDEDFYTAQKLISDEHSLPVTHCILGVEAAAALRYRIRQTDEPLFRLMETTSGVNLGQMDFTQQLSDQGVLFLGTLRGVPIWEYRRTVGVGGPDTGGTAIPLIRSKFAEFICAAPAAENVMYFGAIPDMDAFQGRVFKSERFAKSWLNEDPSAWMSLVHTRPLPVTRRPGSIVSMQVVA